MVSIL
jgi:hypothetical protein